MRQVTKQKPVQKHDDAHACTTTQDHRLEPQWQLTQVQVLLASVKRKADVHGMDLLSLPDEIRPTF